MLNTAEFTGNLYNTIHSDIAPNCRNGGEVVGNGTVTEATDNQLPLSIGCNSNGNNGHIQGAFDECRLLDAVASADWIAAEYATVASATFVTAGDVEEIGSKPGVVIFVR